MLRWCDDGSGIAADRLGRQILKAVKLVRAEQKLQLARREPQRTTPWRFQQIFIVGRLHLDETHRSHISQGTFSDRQHRFVDDFCCWPGDCAVCVLPFLPAATYVVRRRSRPITVTSQSQHRQQERITEKKTRSAALLFVITENQMIMT